MDVHIALEFFSDFVLTVVRGSSVVWFLIVGCLCSATVKGPTPSTWTRPGMMRQARVALHELRHRREKHRANGGGGLHCGARVKGLRTGADPTWAWPNVPVYVYALWLIHNNSLGCFFATCVQGSLNVFVGVFSLCSWVTSGSGCFQGNNMIRIHYDEQHVYRVQK